MFEAYSIQIAGAAAGILSFVIAVVTIWQRYRVRVAQAFFAFALFVSLWITTVFYSDISTNINELVVWTKLSCVFALGFACSFIVFAHVVRGTWTGWRSHVLVFVPAAVMSVAVITYNSSQVYVPNPYDGFAYDGPVGGILHPDYFYFVLFFLGYFFYGLRVLLRRLSSLSFIQKNQVVYIAIGAGLSMGLALAFNGIAPLLGIDYLYSLGAACFLIMVVATCYATVKHRLIDIRLVIQKGAVFSVLLGFVIALYWLILSFVSFFLSEITNTTIVISGFFTALLGTLGVPWLARYFRRLTDHIFFKNVYDFAEASELLSRTLNDNFDLEILKRESGELLARILKVRSVTVGVLPTPRLITSDIAEPSMVLFGNEFRRPVLVADIPETLEHPGGDNEWVQQSLSRIHARVQELKAEIVVPLALKNTFIGIAYVGAKLSEEAFTKKDMDLLTTFSYQAAVAFEKARLLDEVQRYSTELEKMVDERTAQIRELQQEQQQLMGNISHGLQTPLTVLKGELDLLNRQGQGVGTVSTVERSVDEISKLVYSLLALSRIDGVEQAAAFSSVNLSELLEEILEYVAVLCQSEHIAMNAHIQPGIVVFGNREMLRDLIMNLVSNAIKYIANDRVIIVTLKRSLGTELHVQDTGIGIAAESIPLIFNRFYKSGLYAQATSGVGLGLAICKKIVEKHGGRIEVVSTLGIGTTFSVYFSDTVISS